MANKLKTIKDYEQMEFSNIQSGDELFDVIMNTILAFGEANKEYSFTIGDDYGEGTFELCHVDEDMSTARADGWIQIKVDSELEINFYGNSPALYFIRDDLWWDMYCTLELLSEGEYD